VRNCGIYWISNLGRTPKTQRKTLNGDWIWPDLKIRVQRAGVQKKARSSLYLKRLRGHENGGKVPKTPWKIVFPTKEEILKRSSNYLWRDEAEILKTAVIWKTRASKRLQGERKDISVSNRKTRVGKQLTPNPCPPEL